MTQPPKDPANAGQIDELENLSRELQEAEITISEFMSYIKANYDPKPTDTNVASSPVQKSESDNGDDWLDDMLQDFLHDYRQGYDNSREQGLNLEYCTYDTIANFMAAIQSQLDAVYQRGRDDERNREPNV